MDNIFLGCLNGQLEVDTELNRMTKERVCDLQWKSRWRCLRSGWGSLTISSQTGLLKTLEHLAQNAVGYLGRSCRKMKLQQWRCFLTLYRLEEGKTLYGAISEKCGPGVGTGSGKAG